MSLIPELYIQEYEAQVRHLAQARKYRFADSVQTDMFQGERKFYNTLAPTTARAVTTRVGNTTGQIEDFTKRCLTPLPFDAVNFIDENDVKYTNANPLTAFSEAQVSALNRAKTDIVINAALGTAYTGKSGTNAVVLPASQQVAVNYVNTGAPAISGLTLSKILQAKFILDSTDTDIEEERYIVISSKQLEDMLINEKKFTSNLYVEVQALVRGETDMFAGFKFIKSERLPYDVANGNPTYRNCFAFIKSGLIYGANTDITTRVDIRPDLNHSIQVRSIINAGATRLDERKVVSILCNEV